MDSRKLLALATVLLIIEVFNVHAQCNGRVEFINQPSAMPTITTTSYVQPVSQFVIPAVIKPIIQSEPSMAALSPSIPEYSNFYNSLCAGSAMPPIIFDSGSNGDGLDNLLYFLLFALRNRRNGGFGRNANNGGSNCNCGSNNCGGCNRSCGCSNFNSCPHCGGCLRCGSIGNGGGCGKCGGSGSCSGCGSGSSGGNCGCNNGNNSNISCPFGGNCIYIPYPIAVPIGNGPQFGCGGGCPIIETSFGGCDDSSSIQSCNCSSPNEINLIIRTDQ